MSKKSQREAREKREQQEQLARSKYLTTLKGYLSTFALLYRQEVADEAVGAYEVTLRHLSPSELKAACEESMRRCKFFPNPAEILESLKIWRDKQPPQSKEAFEAQPEMTEEEKTESKRQWDEAWEKIKKIGRGSQMSGAPVAAQRQPGEE